MSNPFAMLDLSDDENITVVKPAAAAAPAESKKPHAKPRKELQKEEADLQQKKKGPPGPRGQTPQPEVTHPKERSKLGLKKEEHVNTHPHVDPAAVSKRGERVFDRHSGTGRGKEGKKQGAGGHNWGKPGDEAAAAEPATTEAKEETPAADAAPVVEEDPKMTLEEFEAQRLAKRTGAAFAEKPVRKVQADANLQVVKKTEEVYIQLKEESHEEKKKPQHFKSNAKQVLEIDFQLKRESAEPESAPSFRGGRGGFRGGRGGGAGRGGRGGARGGANSGAPRVSNPATIDTADQSAFPKLGGGA